MIVGRRVEPGSIVLSPTDARILYQVANLGELRRRFRVGDSRVYQLLTDVTVAAFSDADDGTEPRHPAASEEREWWTTEQLSRAAGRAARTIRNDIALGILPATKNPNGWLIRSAHATTYLEGHRRST